MELSADYLAKVRRAIRRQPDEDVDAELSDLVQECRQDLAGLGVLTAKAEDETDPLILGAVRCFVRWKFGLQNPDADVNRQDYFQLRDELRKRVEYCIPPTS